jgi:outer membrane receptor for ferric coprogen and ferric-rhodotorulic acid
MYDGIPSGYTGSTVGAQPNLAMFDRVEVVRGATGLVTGAGNPSAAINLVRKRPLDEQKVTLTGAAGSWDDYRGELDASSPLNDSGTLRGRVVTSTATPIVSSTTPRSITACSMPSPKPT